MVFRHHRTDHKIIGRIRLCENECLVDAVMNPTPAHEAARLARAVPFRPMEARITSLFQASSEDSDALRAHTCQHSDLAFASVSIISRRVVPTRETCRFRSRAPSDWHFAEASHPARHLHRISAVKNLLDQSGFGTVKECSMDLPDCNQFNDLKASMGLWP